jgi:dTDP-4-amino-4,6-dideoxygalactose transaminase
MMFVGGEFYEDPAWVADAPTLSTAGMYFLNGGQACLTVISDFLHAQGIDRVLLPAYLCPSIVHTFARCGLTWDFYQVREDLSLDLEELTHKAAGFQAVYFINYFGFDHDPQTLAFFELLRQRQVIVIEDNAQAGFPARLTGDFAFNSLRKLAAFDGGYLATRHDLRAYLARYQGAPNRRLPLIRAYRKNLARYLFDQAGDHAELESLFETATRYYESDLVVTGDEEERRGIERLDWPGMRQARRDNFRYLMEWVAAIPEIKPIYRELQPDNAPFGLPVYFQDAAVRDQVYEELGRAGIGLTIHWDELRTDALTSGNQRAAGMAGRMLTLTVDQRMTRKKMDYLAQQLIRGIAATAAR